MSFEAAWDESISFQTGEDIEASTIDVEIDTDKKWQTAISWLSDLEHLDEGWDGEDAPIINRAIIKSAEVLLRNSCEIREQPPARIVPTAEGGLVIEWRNSGAYTELEIEEPYRGEVMIVREGEDIVHDTYDWSIMDVRTTDIKRMWSEYGDYSVGTILDDDEVGIAAVAMG